MKLIRSHPKQRFCCLLQEVSKFSLSSAASTKAPQTSWILVKLKSSSVLKRSSCPTSSSGTSLFRTQKICSSVYLPPGLVWALWKILPNSSEIGFYIKHNGSYQFLWHTATGVPLFSKLLQLLNGVWDIQFNAPLCPELIPPVIHYSKEASSPWKSVWDFLIPSHSKGVVISTRTII